MPLPGRFPYKRYAMLEYAAVPEHAAAASWIDEGQAFAIHDKDAFLEHVVPRFFKQTKYSAFVSRDPPPLSVFLRSTTPSNTLSVSNSPIELNRPGSSTFGGSTASSQGGALSL